MIDSQFKVYLIEVNTNPCLEVSSPLLGCLLPTIIENSLKICLDPLFPSPENISIATKKIPMCMPMQENKYHLVFDENIDGPHLISYVKQYKKLNPPILEMENEEGSSESEDD